VRQVAGPEAKPARGATNQQSDPRGPGLEIGRNGEQVDEDNRHQEERSYASAVPLQSQSLKVIVCYFANLCGDGLDYSEQGGQVRATSKATHVNW
jgi:hypothetical protein